MQTYRIPSATTPDKAYTVTIHNDAVMTCSCPDSTFRRRQCKHQRFVLAVWTPAGRSGALVAQHAAAQVKVETGQNHTWAGRDPRIDPRCVCGHEAANLTALAEHVQKARWGERAAALAEENAAEVDLSEVYRITRAIG